MVIFYTNQCWNHDIQTALVQTKVILLFDLTRRLAMEFLRGLSLMRRCRFARKSVPWMEKKKKKQMETKPLEVYEVSQII